MTVLIYSGGLDSTVALYTERPKLALSFCYGSNHQDKEIACAKRHCSKIGIKHKIIDISDAFKDMKSSLLGTESIPEGHYEDASMRSTVVPFRNGLMLVYAIAVAEDLGYEEVLIGAHSGDHAIYPDCRDTFIEAMSKAAELGTYKGVVVRTPFAGKTKADIVALGKGAVVPMHETWSCYKGGELHCGKCGTCMERIEAFKIACVADFTIYDME